MDQAYGATLCVHWPEPEGVSSPVPWITSNPLLGTTSGRLLRLKSSGGGWRPYGYTRTARR
jgi:hypothetical protein